MKHHFAYLDRARITPRLTPWWGVILVALLAIIAGQALGIGIYVGAIIATGQEDLLEIFNENADAALANLSSGNLGILLIATTVLTALLTLFWVRFYEKRPVRSLGFTHLKTGLVQLLTGSFFGIAAIAANVFLLSFLGEATISQATVPLDWYSLWPLVLLLIGWLVQGSSEEIIVRGFVMQSIGARYNIYWGVAISALFFAAFHGLNANTTPLFFINLVLYSLFAAAYVLKERGLWGICGFHSMWNFAQGNLFGIAVSGQHMGRDTVMQTSLGDPFLSGGNAGLEGGLACTGIILISFFVLLGIKRLPASGEVTLASDT